MSASTKIAIIYFTGSAKATAEKIASIVDAEIFDLGKSPDNKAKILQNLFTENTAIIGVCAAGILMRLLAPVIADKHHEPPVIAVSGNGKIIVPLLGGHKGANALAKKIALGLDGVAAITTASDAGFDFALDDPPDGYELANAKAAKSAMAAILNGEALQVTGDAGWLKKAGYPVKENGSVKVIISEFLAYENPRKNSLLFYPKTLVAGVGCARGTGAKEVIDLIKKSLADATLSAKSLAAVATIDIKSDESAFHAAAKYFNVPLKLFSPEELAKNDQLVPNPSEIVKAETGTASVAESAAMFAGQLLVQKQKTLNATCAIGRSEQPVDVKNFGQTPGQLHLVGIGPGAPEQRTFSAANSMKNSSDWVGYGLYLDLISDLHKNQTQHRFELGDEEKRVRFAMELAATGKNVALICSGDAQIYAMASLAYELLQAEGERAVSAGAKRLQVFSHPGISALQMASSKAGALLGHDFCAISLSDLLTPRGDIEKRLLAAAKGDFVTAFYNPRSKRRLDLMEKAKQLYLQYRPGDTPVIIGTNLGRKSESLRITSLEEFNPDEIDMLTIVLFGSSNSKSFMRGNGKLAAFTPRGYASKSGFGS
ncbi:Proposed precorrin-4 hydrolase (analogous to cobalt-precorrin-5A hydrolase) / Precorrin-3B C(17)-methyltransferase [hydrothermal vent metagenome]|uniref:Proposed precorrin-4 hydrolase (Analogous to cobalt-precorrin-5A hydrolase) / Precorrin-3B C(17)-methyltransferase n=1 Tax=hydrothermal vent metagenome TaxID=652676 RepID=A0A3B0TJ10_9ZZZZ